MKTKSLWPLVFALFVMISGAFALEVAARDRGTKTLEVKIVDSASEEGDETESDWNQQPPIDAEHARARVLARRGDFDAALEVSKRLVGTHPENLALTAELGHLQRRAGRLDEAKATLTAVDEKSPNSAPVLVDLALIATAQSRSKEAEDLVQRALKLRPYHSPSLLLLVVFRRSGARWMRPSRHLSSRRVRAPMKSVPAALPR
ncbi:MAG: tetratricopeptide repeat protein [bacterium]